MKTKRILLLTLSLIFFICAESSLKAQDDPCTATAIGVGSTAGSTAGLTETDVADAPNPSCTGFNDDTNCWDAWHLFTAPYTESYTFGLDNVTGGAGSSARMVLYSGAACGALTEAGCGSNDLGTTDVTLALTAGDQIWVRIFDFGCDPDAKTYDVRVDIPGSELLLDATTTGSTIPLSCGSKNTPVFNFRDSGGGTSSTTSGSVVNGYANNENYTITFTAPPGCQIWVKEEGRIYICPGLSGGGNTATCPSSDDNDYLTILDGTNLVRNITGNGNVDKLGSYKSTSGSITFNWVSSASGTNSGWDIEIYCVPDPTTNPVTTVPCGGSVNFTDPGGAVGNYGNDAHEIWTFCPSAGCSDVICADMGMTDLEDLFDALYVFDGNSTSAPLHSFYQESANMVMGTLRASPDNASGCLTFMLVSDAGVDAAGWNSTIETCPAIGSNGAENCANATDISAGGIFQSNTFAATGDPFGNDPNVNIGGGACDPSQTTLSDITQLESTIWYMFTTPNIVCSDPFFSFSADNVSCFQDGNNSGAQFVLYETNSCLTAATWDATRVYCADIIQAGSGISIPAGTFQPNTTYYIMMDAFAGRYCDLDLIVNVENDIDGDGICDTDDIDDDNDGIPDVVESGCAPGSVFGTGGCFPSDPIDDDDMDGTPNWADEDWCTGTINAQGACSELDQDGDGTPNFLDLDADNDGIPDIIEAGGTDLDNDGIVDCSVVDCDSDDDGLFDAYDPDGSGGTNTGGTLSTLTPPNTDGNPDALPDYLDLDSDDDGIPDIVEAGGPDTNNDGYADNYDPDAPSGTDPWGGTNPDDDAWSNTFDGDTNNDGTEDNPGNELIVDCNACGSDDPNGNSVPNHLDLDSDSDGCFDTVEADTTDNDTDDDGIVNITTPINDTDGDGWSDIVDSDNGGTVLANQLTGAAYNNAVIAASCAAACDANMGAWNNN